MAPIAWCQSLAEHPARHHRHKQLVAKRTLGWRSLQSGTKARMSATNPMGGSEIAILRGKIIKKNKGGARNPRTLGGNQEGVGIRQGIVDSVTRNLIESVLDISVQENHVTMGLSPPPRGNCHFHSPVCNHRSIVRRPMTCFKTS